MKEKLFSAFLLLFSCAAFSQQPCTFKDSQTVIRILDLDQAFLARELSTHPKYADDFVEAAVRNHPLKNYVFQSDSAGAVNWMLLCPDPTDGQCSVFQKTISGEASEHYGLKFRPGQLVRLKSSPNRAVKIADFNDFNAGAGYPVLLFDQPYYLTYFQGYWSYLPESALIVPQ